MKTTVITIFLMILAIMLGAQERLRPDSIVSDFSVRTSFPNDAIKPLSLPFSLENVLKSPDFYKVPFLKLDSLPSTWNIFKQAFLAFPLPEEFEMAKRFYHNMELGKNYQNRSIWFDPDVPPIDNWDRGRTYGGGLRAPVFQELYDEYSHEGKMKRKYAGLLRKDSIDHQIFGKYNVELVKQIAGFSDDSTAYAFMRFCDFKNDSLLQANSYDVLFMIRDCLSQYFLLENHRE